VTTNKQHLLILGCGYVGTKLARSCLQRGFHVSAMTRSQARAEDLQSAGITPIIAASPLEIPAEFLQQATHVVDSIPLSRQGSEMHTSQTAWLPALVPHLHRLTWAGYLSTTGVYGDAQGDWVGENHRCNPKSARGQQRLLAEQAWLTSGLPAEVFRLAGIYGPERSLIERLQAGGYKAVSWQPPHYSSRIHVDDVVAALVAAMQAPKAGRIINIADDLPLPHADYVQQLARLLHAPAPHILTPEEGEAQLSPTLLSFFSDNKRISNQRLHNELLPDLHYPTFREGIQSILQAITFRH